MTEKPKRNDIADIAKGLGILLVAAYHLVYRVQDGAADQAIREGIWFAIPFFFLASGYFYRPSPGGLPEDLRRRARTLLLPTVLTELLLLLAGGVYCILAHGYGPRELFRDVAYTFLRPELSAQLLPGWGDVGELFNNLSPVWFVWTMCWATLLFLPLAAFAAGDGRKTALCCAALLIVQLPLYTLLPPTSWSISLAPVCAALMLGASRLRQAGLVRRLLGLPPLPAALAALAAAAVHFALFRFDGTDQVYTGALGTRVWLDVPLFVAEALVGSVFWLGLARLLHGAGITARAVAFIGRHSLVYLLWHCFFGMVFADLMRTYIKPGPNWYVELTPAVFWKSAAGFVLSMLCCAGVALAQERLKRRRE